MKQSPEIRSAANVRAWMAEVGCPAADVTRAFTDRCYLSWSLAFVCWCREHMDTWTLGINQKAHQPFGTKSAVWGGRERRPRWSAQVIEHVDPTSQARMCEIDFDGFNPAGGGAWYEFGHLFEVLANKVWKRKTDPCRVARERGWITTDLGRIHG